MRKSQLLSALAAIVVTPVLLVAVAAPASASSGGLSHNCGSGQTCAGVAQDVPSVGTGSDVMVSCSATTRYVVQATVVQCYIEGNLGDVHYTTPTLLSGQAATQTHTFDSWVLQSRSYKLCIGAGYFSTGGQYVAPDNFVCYPTVAIVT